MKYNIHIIKFTLFLFLFCIGFILYKQLNIYYENFTNDQNEEKMDEEYKFTEEKISLNTLCNNNDYNGIVNTITNMFKNMNDPNSYWSSESMRSVCHNNFYSISQSYVRLIDRFPHLKDKFLPFKHISSEFLKYYNTSHSLTDDSFIDARDGYIKEAYDILSVVQSEIKCFGELDKINLTKLIQKLKQMQGILVLEHINETSKAQFKKLVEDIKNIIPNMNDVALPKSIKYYLPGLFFQKDINNVKTYTNEYFTGDINEWTPGSYNIDSQIYKIRSLETNAFTLIMYSEPNFKGTQKIYKSGTKLPSLKMDFYKTKSFQVIKEPDTPEFILTESYFKRKGTAKKLSKWVNLFEKGIIPDVSKDFDVIGNISLIQTPYLSHFRSLRLVSAGSQNADQEQINLPNFDIKDNGGYNLFRAVVTKDGIPPVSSAFSIKESCKKEKRGIPLEIGTTPLILKNYARNSSSETDKNRYDSTKYFGESPLFIIKNESDEGKNLNNEYKTYYLTNSGNNTHITESSSYKDYNDNTHNTKALYHIRVYNPNTGKFDYALDVDSSGNLQPGKLNKTLQTSLYVYIKTNSGCILENYGYRGIGQTAGKKHYLKHYFDESGREIQKLVTDKTEATIWKFDEITT